MLTFAKQAPNAVLYGLFSEATELLIGLTESGALCRIGFLKGASIQAVLDVWQKEWPRTRFAKNPKPIAKLPKDILLVGTPFQHKVWAQLMKIPPGETISYGEMARRIGKPKAARAVGHALARNPVPWLVPCHRVIKGDGSIGGYAGKPGVSPIKTLLLEREGVLFR